MLQATTFLKGLLTRDPARRLSAADGLLLPRKLLFLLYFLLFVLLLVHA